MHLSSQRLHSPSKGADDIRGMVGIWECPAAPLHFGFHAQTFKKIHRPAAVEAVKRAVEEFGIRHDIPEQFLRIAGIGEITPSLTRDKQLFPQFFILLKQLCRASGPVSYTHLQKGPE